MEKDDIGEWNIVLSLKLHGVFQDGGDTLKHIINKDVVTPEIQESLLSAEHRGQAQMKVFMDKRQCEPLDTDHHLHLLAPFQNNKAKTLSPLYEVVQPSNGNQNKNIITVDRNILQILITAYRAGCEGNLENIIKHELMTVPLYLVTTRGSIHSINKAELVNILTKQVQTTATDIHDEPSCLLPAHWWSSTRDGTWKAAWH